MSNPTFYIKENSLVAKAAAFKLQSKSIAMVLGRTIHLHGTTKENFLANERWLKHELCHVKQFAEYGYVWFTMKYLWESLRVGYYNNKYEVEAREAEQLL